MPSINTMWAKDMSFVTLFLQINSGKTFMVSGRKYLLRMHKYRRLTCSACINIEDFLVAIIDMVLGSKGFASLQWSVA